jgi:hypothetical protein
MGVLPNDDVKQYQVELEHGEFVYQEGDSSVGMYVIERGEVELLKQYAGSSRRVATLEAGDFFGEMSLLEGGSRDGSARALTTLRLLRIDPSTFDHVVREFPEIPIRMLYKLARRLREREDADARAAQIAMGSLKLTPQAPPPPPSEPEEEETVLGTAPALQPVLEHRPTGTVFPLPPVGELAIGRLDRSTGQTPEIDLTAIDTTRSTGRRHARISARGGGYYLREETGTRNGTFVNGRRVQSGEEVTLTDGDRLKFGLIELDLRFRPVQG